MNAVHNEGMVDKEIEHFDSVKLKPISQGLGLDHFADGLPYTPEKRRRQLVQFNFPPSPAQIQTPNAQPIQSTPSFENASPIAAAISRATAAASTPQAEAVTTESTFGEPVTELVRVPKRVAAYAIDFALLTIVYTAVVYVGFALNGFELLDVLSTRQGSQLISPLLALFGVVYIGYFLIQEMIWRTTLGKSVFGIRIQANSSLSVFIRAILFFASAVPFGIGLVWALLDSDSRCWHDVMTGTDLRTESIT